MKKYVLITVIKSSNRNAGPKAPQDISRILKRTGIVESVLLESEEHRDYPLFLRLLQKLKQVRTEDRNVILQYPLQPFSFFEQQELFAKAYSFLNPHKTIIWMHDLNQIRFSERSECYSEIEWLRPFQNYIVHNTTMEKYLRKRIFIRNCILNEVFDYLYEPEVKGEHNRREPSLEPEIVFAGNLAHDKSLFLYDLDPDKMGFRLNVYGKREGLLKNPKICYRGNFDADILPGRLQGDMGLIWDGAITSMEVNSYKNYTRYNAPHKFSCYMAAGLPVIAWREAAIAEVIQKYQVGYLIDNLYEINSLDLSRYPEYQRNAQDLGEKVRSGYFTKRVFAQIEERWNDLWF